jgi:hypothetical protein
MQVLKSASGLVDGEIIFKKRARNINVCYSTEGNKPSRKTPVALHDPPLFPYHLVPINCVVVGDKETPSENYLFAINYD